MNLLAFFVKDVFLPAKEEANNAVNFSHLALRTTM